MSRIKNSFLQLALAILSAVVLGCATDAQKEVTAFANATKTATNNVASAFQVVETKHYQAQANALVLNYPKSGYEPGSIKPFLTQEQINSRLTVLKSVQLYAQKLAEVMSDKQLNEFDEDTKEFGAALLKLNKNTVLAEAKLQNQDLEILATAVNAIGRWFIEYKREKAIASITLEMQPKIKAICDLLSKDIGKPPNDQHVGGDGLRNQLWIDYVKILRDQDALLQKEQTRMDFATWRDEIAKLPALELEYQSADHTLEATQATLKKLAETHGKLYQAFQKNGYELNSLIQQLIDEAEHTESFYEELKKT